MTNAPTPQDPDITDQIEQAIETVLDLANPPHEQDASTGEPFVADETPLGGVPAVTDAELEQQALVHPGGDGTPATPE
jgi:hypothetical protein